MSAVRAFRFGDGLVIERGAAAPLLLLDAAGRAVWRALDEGWSADAIARALPEGAARVAEIAAARVPAPVPAPAAVPTLRRPRRPRVRVYALAGRRVALDSADAELEALLHSRFAHVETDAGPAATLRLRRAGTGFALVEAGRPAAWHPAPEALAGAVVRRMVEICHGTPAGARCCTPPPSPTAPAARSCCPASAAAARAR